jgi:hypothetical protein
MADAPKTVRLTHADTGVVVETDEENASRLSGYAPEGSKSTAKKSSSSKSSK